MSQSRLSERLDEMKDEILEGIQKSVQIDSVATEAEENAPYGPGPKAALDFALHLGEELGFRTGNVDNHAGYVEYGEGEEMVAVLGHMDVVPTGDDWKYPPFGGEIHDGVMYGRGVVDDKGPTIGAIYALKAIRDLDLPIDRRIRVIFGTNEERGSSCIQYYVEKGEEQPVMGITPDAEFPLIFFEKGMTNVTAGCKNPAQGAIKVLEFQGGTVHNIVPLHCRLVLEGEHEIPEAKGVTVTKENGNTVLVSEGVSAHGRGLGICYQDEETGETTVNLGVIEGTEKDIHFVLDIRYPKNGKKEEVQATLEKQFGEAGLEILSIDHTDMLYVPKDSELVQKLMKVYREGTGQMDAQPKAIGGGTYAKMFKNMVAFGPIFPGDPDVVHQPNEAVEIEKLMQSIKLVAEAMAEMARK